MRRGSPEQSRHYPRSGGNAKIFFTPNPIRRLVQSPERMMSLTASRGQVYNHLNVWNE